MLVYHIHASAPTTVDVLRHATPRDVEVVPLSSFAGFDTVTVSVLQIGKTGNQGGKSKIADSVYSLEVR